MRRVERQECTCKQCGRLFWVLPCVIRDGGGKFCGRACYGKSISGPKGPLRDRIWGPGKYRVDAYGNWLWTGATLNPTKRGTGGYGIIGVEGKILLAHRVSYELAYGPIPKGMWVLHNCPGPEGDKRSCIRPTHLWIGDHADNTRDAVQKGRYSFPCPQRGKGTLNGAAKLTEDQVLEIRRLRGFQSQASLAAQFGVSSSLISLIHQEKLWTHI